MHIKLIKSIIGCADEDKILIKFLGLKKPGHFKIIKYDHKIINMIYKVYYLLEIKIL